MLGFSVHDSAPHLSYPIGKSRDNGAGRRRVAFQPDGEISALRVQCNERKPMSPLILTPVPLSIAAFAPFGAVLEADGTNGVSVNSGWAWQFDQAPAFAHTTGQAWPSTAIYRNRPRDLPIDLQELERHPFSCQLFMPMGASRWLVAVAPDDAAGRPDVVLAQAFLASGRQGICYRPGVWHSPLLGLDEETDFFMLMWSRNPSDDTEVHLLDRLVQIRLE